ncbi:yrdC domain-containing protein, mitochondrial [Amazona aestiva]|uniref:Threonylcarbamoyl-AMP synthase n=1 Tax=Amazona aestiva TaxID=12930 RepID=A0A0Q3U492_AMAAE|nr:yrdC domain-containing protein, mitochondrial [Amazona aestiva]
MHYKGSPGKESAVVENGIVVEDDLSAVGIRVKLHPIRVNVREERLCKEGFVPGEWPLTVLGKVFFCAAFAARGLVHLNHLSIGPDNFRNCFVTEDSGAVRSIYSLKGRNGRKPLAICVGDVERLYRYCRVNVPDALLRDLLPGPVTLVLQRSEELNKDLNPFTSLVGVRIPNHPFIRELARACSGPLALTSANISSQASTLTVSEFQDLWPQLSLIIDGGPIGDVQSPECRLGSTVVDLSVSGKFSIIRPGCALTSTVEILTQKYGLVPESS